MIAEPTPGLDEAALIDALSLRLAEITRTSVHDFAPTYLLAAEAVRYLVPLVRTATLGEVEQAFDLALITDHRDAVAAVRALRTENHET